tara:strand:+ start:4054 stop:4194 length:141 start_codon:yes stop_codon:yes gene_type:complete
MYQKNIQTELSLFENRINRLISVEFQQVFSNSLQKSAGEGKIFITV